MALKSVSQLQDVIVDRFLSYFNKENNDVTTLNHEGDTWTQKRKKRKRSRKRTDPTKSNHSSPNIMKSELSARLLRSFPQRGQGSSNSDSGVDMQWWKTDNPFKHVDKMVVRSQSAPVSVAGSRRGGSSGYQADLERTSTESDDTRVPPVSIDFLHRGRGNSSRLSVFEQKKKRKLEEANYSASTAKKVLTHAGFKIPTIQMETSRVLPADCGISLSKSVDHVHSNTFKDSPFLTNNRVDCLDFYTDMSLLTQIVKSCASYYPLPPVESKEGQETPKTPIASVTEPPVEAPRGYESSTSSVTEDLENSEPDEDIVSQKEVSIGDALAFCQDARIITVSEAPYCIVHVNAAFTNVTGLGSIKVLGRPLGDLVQGSNLLYALKTANDTLKTQFVRRQGFKTRTLARAQDYMPCSVLVSPVFAASQPATHLAMEIKADSQVMSSSSIMTAMLAQQQRENTPFQTLG